MGESMVVGISASEKDKEAWEDAARRAGVGLPDFIRECLHLRMGFSPYFWKRLQALSEDVKVPPSLALENMVLARLARRAAEKIVYDLDAPPLAELLFGDTGTVRGRELEKLLTADAVNEEVKEFTREIRDNLNSTAGHSREIHVQNLRSANKDLEEMISRIGDYKDHPKIRRHIDETLNYLRQEIARIAGT